MAARYRRQERKSRAMRQRSLGPNGRNPGNDAGVVDGGDRWVFNAWPMENVNNNNPNGGTQPQGQNTQENPDRP